MMPPPEEESRILDPCPNCTTLIDVSSMEPFSEVHCPICGTKMRVRKQFNHFALQHVLGEGGMGTVFEAIDLNLQRPVAVKILKKEFSADEESITKLETEARITASISHPHVVKVFSAGRDHGQFYLAMELVGKGTLDQLMSLQGRVAEIQVLDVGIQIADGLRAAAQTGLIHRDVKPGNILFSDAHTAKVVDFGLAILMEDEAKNRGEIWGTPYYVAPEKLNNEQEDFRSDIYSLGGTMFHALSGRPPFEAASASLVALKHLKSQAVSLQAFAPDVSNETAYVINRMLHKDPLERYQSYDELIEHLKYAKAQIQERTSAGLKPKPRVVVESDAARSFTAWITLILIVMMLGVGAFVWMKRKTLFSGPDSPFANSGESSAVADDVNSEYNEAVSLLSKGQTDDAEALFTKVIATPNVPQPRLNWARQQRGLALLLSERNSDARQLFASMESEGLYSSETGEVRLASYFVECGRLMKDSAIIPGTATLAYDNTDFEAMALLLFAMKDWSMGGFTAAGPLLEKFAASNLGDAYRWIGAYKPLAEKYLSDYKLYDSIAQKIADAKTSTAKASALKALQSAKSQLLTTGPLPLQFEKWQLTLQKEVSASSEAAKQSAAAVAEASGKAEAEKWESLAKKAVEAFRNFSPESVPASELKSDFSDGQLRGKKDALQHRLTVLAEFKQKLIAGIKKTSYALPIKTRNGSIIPGAPSEANTENILVRSPYGAVPVRWKEVSPATILDMGDKLILDVSVSQKQWLMGAYATLCGEESKGRQMLLDAAQSDEKLRDDLVVFFEQSP